MHFWAAKDVDKCVFHGINDRLPKDAHDHLNMLAPKKEQLTDIAYCEGRHKLMENYLLKNRSALFTDKAESHCTIHDSNCPIFDTYDES